MTVKLALPVSIHPVTQALKDAHGNTIGFINSVGQSCTPDFITCDDMQKHTVMALNAHAALVELRKKYNHLHDVLSDCIESGRLSEADLPDDYKALAGMLQQCSMADSVVAEILKGK